MNGEKIEIKFKKSNISKFLINSFFSLFVSFIILFSISLKGYIHPKGLYYPFEGTKYQIVYDEVLFDGQYYGNGEVYFWKSSSYYDINGKYYKTPEPEYEYTVENNLFIGDLNSNDLTLEIKIFCFCLPYVLFEKFWLWIFLSIFLFLSYKLIIYLKNKYTIKFE